MVAILFCWLKTLFVHARLPKHENNFTRHTDNVPLCFDIEKGSIARK